MSSRAYIKILTPVTILSIWDLTLVFFNTRVNMTPPWITDEYQLKKTGYKHLATPVTIHITATVLTCVKKI